MKIGIITVYESITNIGSFLQAHALKTILSQMGHEVYVIQNTPTSITIKKCLLKLNPKRELLMRVKKSIKFYRDMKLLPLLPKDQLKDSDLDLLIYGSDEIWNLDNPYFKNDLFWGLDGCKAHRVAYAVSVGAMRQSTMDKNPWYFSQLLSFDAILVRDNATRDMLTPILGCVLEEVCDPTILLPLEYQEEPIQLPKKPYLLVYTYGLDAPMERVVVDFARKKGLEIVSPCFWHLWADRVVECGSLQFSSLIKGAEYVFTSTFHGAIFTLLNHKNCAILPVRPKVEDVVQKMGEAHRLVPPDCSTKYFEHVMETPFDSDQFEYRINGIRTTSKNKLLEVLQCLEN